MGSTRSLMEVSFQITVQTSSFSPRGRCTFAPGTWLPTSDGTSASFLTQTPGALNTSHRLLTGGSCQTAYAQVWTIVLQVHSNSLYLQVNEHMVLVERLPSRTIVPSRHRSSAGSGLCLASQFHDAHYQVQRVAKGIRKLSNWVDQRSATDGRAEWGLRRLK